MTHVLKADKKFFYEYKNGNKTSSLRFNDRNYCVGDICVIFPIEKDTMLYAEEPAVLTITHVLKDYDFKVVPKGYCILSLRKAI